MNSPTKIPTTDEQVLIVPASRVALEDYERFSAYVYRPHRSFRITHYVGFYADGKIAPRVPRILDRVVSVVLSPEAITGQPGLMARTRQALLSLVARLEQGRPELVGKPREVFLLSEPDDPRTLKLPREVVNDLKATSGRTVPFARSQRYVPLAKLETGPARTSELI